ncbi:MAG: hypothetical protein LC746_01045 [Acidobacteria bacterium]|nr:hypothetical protein [Acidobacteriota bacterium]
MRSLILSAFVALTFTVCRAQTTRVAPRQKIGVEHKGATDNPPPDAGAKPCTRGRVRAYFDALASHLPPRALERSRQIARSPRMKNAARSEASGGVWLSQFRAEAVSSVKNDQTNYAVLGNLDGVDIEAVAFIVMMEATKSAQDDLKSIMQGVKDINKEKEKQRELMKELEALRENESRLTDEACRYIEQREKPTRPGKKP